MYCHWPARHSLVCSTGTTFYERGSTEQWEICNYNEATGSEEAARASCMVEPCVGPRPGLHRAAANNL
jgi:hypothetical protein